MQARLQNISNMFAEPSNLPPTREIDHGIPLRKGIEPVNVRPSRYAHYQKNKIEKQVQEMLKVGLVRHNTSTLYSPILLVKKKDGA